MKLIHPTFEYIHDDGYGKVKIGQSTSLIFYLLKLSSYVAIEIEMIGNFIDHSILIPINKNVIRVNKARISILDKRGLRCLKQYPSQNLKPPA